MYQLLILSAPDDDDRTRSIAGEWKKLGGTTQIIQSREMVFESESGNLSLIHPTVELTQVDAVLGMFNGVMVDYVSYINQLTQSGAVTLSNDSGNQSALEQSFIHRYTHVEKAGVRMPKTIYFTPISLHKALEHIEFPLIIKRLHSSSKHGIRFFKNDQDIKNKWGEIAMDDKVFVAKEYIQNKAEWRVVVIDHEVVAIYERHGATDHFLSGFQESAERIAIRPEDRPDLCDIALEICKLLNYDISGIDIIQDMKNDLYVLDINRYFQFKVTEEITGVNIAQKIAQLLWKKVELKRNSVVQYSY
jgi:glutathione synthase/RimK-type ligase-like ATP-grasp enzyme